MKMHNAEEDLLNTSQSYKRLTKKYAQQLKKNSFNWQGRYKALNSQSYDQSWMLPI